MSAATTETARFAIQPNGDVTIELSAAATEEEEAIAVAIAEDMCAAANGIGPDEEEDEGADDFIGFMRKRAEAAAASPDAWPEDQLPPQKQLALLDHLDDLAFQGTFWE